MKKFIIAFSLLALAGCQTVNSVHKIATAAIISPEVSKVDWKKILPPPPENNTEINFVITAQGTKSGTRWEQAKFDNAYEPFAMYRQILGDGFTIQNNPELAAVLTYASKVQYKYSEDAKNAYLRVRPFNYDKNVEFCVKDKNPPSGSSYPSGHTSWGWLSAQIIARAYPSRADDILQRGREYGESRVVCGAHFPSDLVGGRIIADVILQRLETDKEYKNLFAKVKPQ